MDIEKVRVYPIANDNSREASFTVVSFSSANSLRCDPRDNIAIAMLSLPSGTPVDGVVSAQPISRGHKIALRPIVAGEAIIKGGTSIGVATVSIPAGGLVNAEAVRLPDHGGLTVSADTAREPLQVVEGASFRGFVRADGRVGTRNTIGVFVVGNCGATAARRAADWFDTDRMAAFPNVDAVVPYVHEIGCGMEMTGEPMDLLRRTISGTIRNPNTAAAVVVALGCERNNLRSFLEQERLEVGDKLRTVTIQEVGGISNAIEAAKEIIREMLPEANCNTRQEVGAEHLVLGLKSGASDGFSGLSANPALGAAVDMLVASGGTAILAETPDMMGAIPDLLRRASDPRVRGRLEKLFDWWQQHTSGRDTKLCGRLGREMEAAGLLTVIENSLDGIKKAGSSPLQNVYRYAESVTERGLVFMDTPGYDPVSVTGQIAGGANLIALTTGRGSVFGSLPAPTVKLASNSETFARMGDDTDIDCGSVLSGRTTVAEMGYEIFSRLLQHASGEKTKAELDGVGENEFVPWPIGVLA